MSNKNFKPAWWLSNPHLQTLWPTFCRRRIKHLIVQRERFELPDGDFVDVDWVGKAHASATVLILHGLEGSIDSPYAQGMLSVLQQRGWRAGLLHFRGCSRELNRLPRTYHAGDTADLAAVIEILLAQDPKTPLAAIGFSLGGNVLLKWLGETGKKNPLVAAVAISTPFNLAESVQRINRGFSRIYQWHLLSCLRKKIRWKFSTQLRHIDISSLATIKTIHDFDDKITAQLHGFSSADEYYAKASSHPYLHAIRIPTLLVQSKDDPFMQEGSSAVLQNSRYLKLEITEKGGHVGFISGNAPWRILYWLEERVPEFLANCLGTKGVKP